VTEATLVVRLDADGKPLSLGLRKATGEVQAFGLATEQAGAKAGAGLKRASADAGGLGRSLDDAKRKLLAFVTVAGVAYLARQLGQMADTAANLRGRLALVTNGTDDLVRTQRELYAISQRTSTGLEATTALYTRMASALKDAGASGGEMLGLTETINQAFIVSGASAAEQASAVMQLGQAFAAGRLAGEEFNAVNEAAPRLMQALADSLGVPRGALKKLAEDGALTSDVLRKAFSGEQAKRIAEEFARMPVTIGNAFTQLGNAALMVVDQLDQASGASSAVAKAVQAVAQAVELVLPFVLELTKLWASQSGAQLDVASTAQGIAQAMKVVITGLVLAKNAVDVVINTFKALVQIAAAAAEAIVGGFRDTAEILPQLAKRIVNPLEAFNDGDLFGGILERATARAEKFAELSGAAIGDFAADMATDVDDVSRVLEEALKPTAALEKGTKALATASGTYAGASAKAKKATAEEKREMREAARAAREHFEAIDAVIRAHNEYETAVAILGEGYANETALLRMSNGERAVALEMLRFTSDQYEHLSGMTEEARAAELRRIEATVRGGQASQQAAEGVQDLVDRFGQLEDVGFGGLIRRLGDVRKQLAEVMKAGTDPARAAELRETIVGMNFEIAQGTVGSLRQATDAMAGLFEEGSKGQKKMQQASAALTVVQAALASVEAVRAVLKQATEGDVWSAFGRMAAMAAAVAPLIAAIGGAMPAFNGGPGSNGAEARQRTQGTGTVLGDAEAKSESMLNALEITADATRELVGINRGMLNALQAMQRGIGAASGSLARTGFADLSLAEGAGRSALFDPLGIGGGTIASRLVSSIFGGDQDLIDQGLMIRGGTFGNVSRDPRASAYQTIETDGGWFGSDRVSDELEALGADATEQIRLILGSIGDTVREGALALGLNLSEINERIEAFRVEAIRISTMDLTGEEAREELQAAFSAIFDDLAVFTVPFIEQFQRVGEGFGETLARVATSVQVTREGLFQLGKALGEMEPEQLAQLSVGLVEAAGGIEEFISGMQSFVANFAPDAHRFAVAQSELTRALAQVGLELPTTREGMWALMQSLDATTESGQAQIATLLRLSGTADAYYNQLEESADEAAAAAERAADAERERAERIADILAGGADALAATNREIAEFGLSPLRRQQLAIERETAEAMAAARAEEAESAQLLQIALDGVARSAAAAALAALEFGTQLEQWQFEDALAGMSDLEQSIARNDRVWQQRLADAIELFGEGSEEAVLVLSLWTRSTERLTDAATDAGGALNGVAASLQTISRAAANAGANGARQSWAEILAEATIGVRGDGLTEQQRAIAQLNERFAGFRNQLQDAFAEALPGALAFGNADALRAELDARLAELDALRLEALRNIEAEGAGELGDAIEERYRRELEWVREVAGLIDNLLLDQQLSPLTHAERIAEAQRQYDVTRLAAVAGDLDARERYAEVVNQLLREGRDFWGSSQAYDDLFARVLADQREIVANAPTSAASITSSPAAAVFAPMASSLDGLRNDTKAGSAATVAHLQSVEAKLDEIARATADQARELRRANDLAQARAR
jgi:tape measure domain-containing protein